mmetsp:Transcript_58169/g.67913  ORF Transcript_58169/g.67913 Transcript_58169/m.67913 type:complete len:202 (-) Transcript_58169:689-1294(-)
MFFIDWFIFIFITIIIKILTFIFYFNVFIFFSCITIALFCFHSIIFFLCSTTHFNFVFNYGKLLFRILCISLLFLFFIRQTNPCPLFPVTAISTTTFLIVDTMLAIFHHIIFGRRRRGQRGGFRGETNAVLFLLFGRIADLALAVVIVEAVLADEHQIGVVIVVGLLRRGGCHKRRFFNRSGCDASGRGWRRRWRGGGCRS